MDKSEKISLIKNIYIETINESYKAYGMANNFSQEEIDRLISENAPGLEVSGEALAEKIYSSLFN